MPRRLCQLPVSLTVPRSTQPQHASCSRASLPTYPGGLVGTGPGGDSALLSKPGQAMAETASLVVTPANILLARASHAAELTQGVGWSPHPQCRVAKGTDMGRVERQPSDNGGQVHGSAHTSPWPCTAQSRNSETMSSPGSARSHLAPHGHRAPAVCRRRPCQPPPGSLSVSPNGKEVVPPNHPQGVPTKGPFQGEVWGPPGTAAAVLPARLALWGKGWGWKERDCTEGHQDAGAAAMPLCSRPPPHPGDEEAEPTFIRHGETGVRSVSRGMEGLGRCSQRQPLTRHPDMQTRCWGSMEDASPSLRGSGDFLGRPVLKRDNQSGLDRAGEVGHRQGAPMQREWQGPRSPPTTHPTEGQLEASSWGSGGLGAEGA